MTRTAREQDTVRIFDVKEHSKTRKGLLSMARSVLTLKFTSVLTIVSICMTPCHCTCQDRIHCGRIHSNVTHMYTHLQVCSWLAHDLPRYVLSMPWSKAPCAACTRPSNSCAAQSHSRSHGTRWCLLERVVELPGRRLTSVQSCFGRDILQTCLAMSYGLVEEAGINTRML